MERAGNAARFALQSLNRNLNIHNDSFFPPKLAAMQREHIVESIILEGGRHMNRATAIAVGIAIGVALGVAMHNVAIGIGIGVALGAAFGATSRKRPG